MSDNNPIIIIRKCGNEYRREVIPTLSVLEQSVLDDELNRKNVILRLRKDPSVVLLFDVKDGFCEEKAVLFDGFEIVVSLYEGRTDECCEVQEGKVTIYCNGEVFFEKDYFMDDNENEYRHIYFMANDVADYLNELAEGDYQHFVTEDTLPDGNHMKLLDVFSAQCIVRMDYEYEYIDVLSGYAPMLFIFENEVVLLGSRHLSNNDIFIEIKRLRLPVDEFHKKYIRSLSSFYPEVDVIFWEDGSVGFRRWFPRYHNPEQNNMRIYSRLNELKTLVAYINKKMHVTYDADQDMTTIRQLFIYESINESSKLKQMLI